MANLACVMPAKGFRLDLARHYEGLIQMAFDALGAIRSAADNDSVHSLRISLRSQRVLLALFKGDAELGELRQHLSLAAKLAGEVRDLEVLVGLAEQLGVPVPRRSQLKKRYRERYADLDHALLQLGLDDDLFDAQACWLRNLSQVRKPELRSEVRRAALRRAQRLQGRLGRLARQGTDRSGWHLLRVKVKQLRYWQEGYGEFLPRRLRLLGKPLRQLQQVLGEWHDLQLLRQVLGEQCSVALSGRIAEREHQVAERVAQQLARFDKPLRRALRD